jgi:hypothetical protein
MDLSRESLLDDFSTMLTDAEDLLRRAGNVGLLINRR